MFDDHGLPGSRPANKPPRSGDDAPFFAAQREPMQPMEQTAADTPPAPARFGRLAICVAAAGALALGVVGTVAYGIWFNHDQQAYAQAISGARQALGTPGPATADGLHMASTDAQPGADASARASQQSAAQSQDDSSDVRIDPAKTLAQWSGQITPAMPADNAGSIADDPATFAALASVDPDAMPASATRANLRGASSNAHAQQTGATRARDARLAQNRRASEAGAKHKDSLFARVSQFFRRVSYRQHGNSNQQDIYSHP